MATGGQRQRYRLLSEQGGATGGQKEAGRLSGRKFREKHTGAGVNQQVDENGLGDLC